MAKSHDLLVKALGAFAFTMGRSGVTSVLGISILALLALVATVALLTKRARRGPARGPLLATEAVSAQPEACA